MSFRFALLSSTRQLVAWEAESVKELAKENRAMCVAWVSTFGERVETTRQSLLRATLGGSEATSVLNVAVSVPALKHALRVPCVFTARGHSIVVDGPTLQTLRGMDLDFVLYTGPKNLVGEIVSCARLGTWTFRFGDPNKDGSQITGFWEILNGKNVVQASLIQLGASRGVVLRSGHYAVIRSSYARTIDAIHFGAARWPAFVCRALGRDLDLASVSTGTIAEAEPALAPRQKDILKFVVMTKWRQTIATLHTAVYRPMWNVARIPSNIDVFLNAGKVPRAQWLGSSGTQRFLADPFAVNRCGTITVLAEEFDYREGKGRIVAFDLTDSGRDEIKVAIEEPHHLSFPYLLEHDGRIFCVPESFETREIALYEAAEFPTRWTRVATLVRDFAGNDSTIIEERGKWWLFSTDHDLGFTSTLCVFSADRLYGPWIPHPMNPVKIDARSACSAGTPFKHDGVLYRPAQDCSEQYGKRVVINKVTCLTETRFSEEPVAFIEAFSGRYHAGTHTVSSVGDQTLVDGQRFTMHFDGLRRLAKKYARSALSAIGMSDEGIVRLKRRLRR